MAVRRVQSFNHPESSKVVLEIMTQNYTGSQLYPNPTTNPGSLELVWYGAPQTEVGTYYVAAMINEETTGYQGSAHGWFTIEPAGNQTINVSQHAPANALNGSIFNVVATSSSALAVTIGGTGSCSGSGIGTATIP